MVLKRLKAFGLQLNLGKCHIAQPEVLFLGYCINEQATSLCQKKLK